MALKRYEWTRALVEGDPALAHALAHEAESQCDGARRITVVDGPREELVMVQVRETAQGTLFYLGEALMTSCRVRVGAQVGRGMILGSDRRAAFDLAVVDATLSAEAGSGPFSARWEGALRRELARVDEREADAARRAARTKVNFSTMQVEA